MKWLTTSPENSLEVPHAEFFGKVFLKFECRGLNVLSILRAGKLVISEIYDRSP